MALVFADRVLETSTTTGTGAYTLSGAVAGYQAASAVCSNNDTFYYYAETVDINGIPTGSWETGLGTWGTGGILTRTTVNSSSSSGSPVNWGAGTKRIALGLTSTLSKSLPQVVGTTTLLPTNSTKSLGNWKMCDGSYYSRTDYPLTTDFIGKVTNTNRTFPTSRNSVYFYSSAYGAGVWIAVEYADGAAVSTYICTSSNGVDFTRTLLLTTAASQATDIVFGGGLFVMVRTGTTVYYTSPDGTAWQSRTLLAGVTLPHIAHNGTAFCLIGTGQNSYTSTDGINWTTNTSALPSNSAWSGIAWNGSVFCAAVSAAGSTAIATSPDGIIWTARTGQSGTWEGMAWNGTVFCTVNSAANGVQTSPDGTTWTARTLASGGANSIAWESTIGLFAVFSALSNSTAYTSPDGTTWTNRVNGASSGNTTKKRIAGGGGGRFIGGYSTGASSSTTTSTDGITWDKYQRPNESYVGWGSYKGGVYVIIGANGSIIRSSNSGITWSIADLPSYISTASLIWSSISNNGTIFCVALTSSNLAATSPDGITWTPRTLPSVQVWNSMTWNGTVFCLVGGTAFGATSLDGITWTPRTLPTTTSWTSIGSNSAGLMVAVGNNGIATSSDNGTNWTSRTSPITQSWTGVAYNSTSNLWIIVSSASVIGGISSDGITWNKVSLPLSVTECTSIAGHLVISGSGGTAYSRNGYDWMVTSTLTLGSEPLFSDNTSVVMAGSEQQVLDDTFLQVPIIANPVGTFGEIGSGLMAYHVRLS